MTASNSQENVKLFLILRHGSVQSAFIKWMIYEDLDLFSKEENALLEALFADYYPNLLRAKNPMLQKQNQKEVDK